MRLVRIASLVSPLGICLLTALIWLGGAPDGLSNGSSADFVAGLLFVLNLIPALLAVLGAQLLQAVLPSTITPPLSLGLLWASLSAVQWWAAARLLERARIPRTSAARS